MIHGACCDGAEIYTAQGFKLGDLVTPRIAGPDVPGGGGIMRPILAKILAAATRESGTQVRLGCRATALAPVDDGVDVQTSDGSRRVYDLVIAADGAHSSTRQMVFADAPTPKYTGQGVWRAVVPRPKMVEQPSFYLGTRLKAGVNPVSASEMYLFLTEDRPDNKYVEEAQLLRELKNLLAEFSAPVPAYVLSELDEDSHIVFRPLEAMLLPEPWYRGGIVVIGDAAHASTPHLASGAGMGVEDAVVLAEEVQRAASVSEALQRFQSRRMPRCRLVVENSVRLGEIEQTNGSKEEHADLMRRSMMALAAPY
jgi:2-polyprenyl-6-methoxyphenol hydroxylase-like FAD-dependent oxidoreductase